MDLIYQLEYVYYLNVGCDTYDVFDFLIRTY